MLRDARARLPQTREQRRRKSGRHAPLERSLHRESNHPTTIQV
jgi:hypothetical protein